MLSPKNQQQTGSIIRRCSLCRIHSENGDPATYLLVRFFSATRTEQFFFFFPGPTSCDFSWWNWNPLEPPVVTSPTSSPLQRQRACVHVLQLILSQRYFEWNHGIFKALLYEWIFSTSWRHVGANIFWIVEYEQMEIWSWKKTLWPFSINHHQGWILLKQKSLSGGIELFSSKGKYWHLVYTGYPVYFSRFIP
jgi:hypothetical protein